MNFPAASAYNERRFWAHVEIPEGDECWPWTGCLDKDGYGQRTHCRRGHALVAEHVLMRRDGGRICRLCRRAYIRVCMRAKRAHTRQRRAMTQH
jgi:hypothetical protein